MPVLSSTDTGTQPRDAQPGLRQDPVRHQGHLPLPAEEPALLEAARGEPRVVLDRPGADHLPAAEVQERHPALRHVRARSPGHAGFLLVLLDASAAGRRAHRRTAVHRREARRQDRVEADRPARQGRAPDEVGVHASTFDDATRSAPSSRWGTDSRRGRFPGVHALDARALQGRAGGIARFYIQDWDDG